jgi:molybdenum cofactor synthesis domain-containing protein
MSNLITASYLIIGDEILSGRTQDKNLNFIAKELVLMGINLKEVRVVLDNEDEIILAVNSLRKKYNYLFTTGGIGPTHDDITSKAIAMAFNDKLIKNKEAESILINHYGKENVNQARLKMAYVPSKSRLLDNPVSSAPGFMIENVIVMAGVPKIMQHMFFAAKKSLKSGVKIISKEIRISLTESLIAQELEELQNQYQDISIGSYPFQGGTSLIFRGSNSKELDNCIDEMVKILHSGNKNCITEINK